MRILSRLRAVALISIGSLVLLLPILVLSLRNFEAAMAFDADIDTLRNLVLERASLRDQYFLYREERARAQWDGKNSKFSLRLKETKALAVSADDIEILHQMEQNSDETLNIFQRLTVRNSIQEPKTEDQAEVIREFDRRLVNQMVVKVAVAQDMLNMLQENSQRRVGNTYWYLIGISAGFMAVLSLLTAFTLTFIIRLVRQRLEALYHGAGIVAEGNLDFRIEEVGEDELTAVARSINRVAQKLQLFNRELENELIERKKNEEKLILAGKVFTDSSEAILITDADSRILTVNPGFSRITGYSPEEAIGQSTYVLKSRYHDAEFYSLMLTGVRERGHWQGETWSQRKSGEIYPIWLSISAVTDGSGQVTNYVRMATDITERKRGESALAESEFLYRSLFERGNIGVAVTSPEKGWLHVNPRLCQILGYDESELLTMTWAEITHPDDLPASDHNLELMLNGFFDRYEMEKRYFHKDGHIIYINLSVSCYRKEGKVKFLIGSILDISERKRAEIALQHINELLEARVAERTQELQVAQAALFRVQRMEAIGQLTGGVAHDFNNMLTVVAGALELVMHRTASDECSHRWLAMASKAVDRGARLTASLLAFSRRQTLNTEPLDANALIQESMTLVARAAGEAIRLELVLDPALPACQADASQLEAALINLVINACDAMPAGGELAIATWRAVLSAADLAENPEASPGEFVAIAVTDTGSGMSEEIKARAFEPFYTTKEPGKGTGLGLSQIFGFVRQLGGHVVIDSAEGQGTTVTLYLPCATAVGCPEDPEAKQDTRAGVLGSTSVLIVEDEEAVREVTAEMLRSVGCRVLAVSDGPAALDLLRREPWIDLLLTDVVMPGGMTGVELARAARAFRPGLPVLLVSGYASAALERHGASPNEFEIIGKPYYSTTLVARVAELAGGNHRQAENANR